MYVYAYIIFIKTIYYIYRIISDEYLYIVQLILVVYILFIINNIIFHTHTRGSYTDQNMNKYNNYNL